MKHKHSVNIIIEDILSEVVMQRLLAQVGYRGETTFRIARGNGQIKTNISKYKQASRVIPHIVLTDLDRYPCPPALLDAWGVGKIPPTMLIRVAVREVEAWLLSDRNGIATFINSSVERIPLSPEAEADPKQTLFNAIRKTRKRRLIEEMVPQPGAHIGPMYNDRMCDFAQNYWRIEKARKNAPSLARALTQISEFLYS